MPKQSNTVRIVVLGESAARGYPQPHSLTAADLLRRLLQVAWPERRVEVLNLACTAIASYPVRDLAREALVADPDVAIVYMGNNEFFGAYGVASQPRWLKAPFAQRFQYALHGWALIQLPMGILRRMHRVEGNPQLIELMSRHSEAARDQRLHKKARASLEANLDAVIKMFDARGIPAIICTSPTNERDLAPIGEDPAAPQEALHHWHRGRAALAEGRIEEARAHILAARDTDPMPWRATSDINNAIRRVARARNAPLCDLVEAFQQASPHRLIGWEWMDDHVHPSLAGQIFIAREWAKAIGALPPPLRMETNEFARLPSDEQLLVQAGDNRYERFAVAHTMRTLFDVPFFKRSNPEAAARFKAIGEDLLSEMPSFARATTLEWLSQPTLSVGRRPLSGVVAIAYLQQNQPREALPLLRAARASSPAYTTWDIEYTYFDLLARWQIQGELTEAERADARAAIERARVLQRYGHTASGQTERFAGRLHQLLGEDAESIAWLESARRKLGGMDRVACDKALVSAYLSVGRANDAETIARAGLEMAPQYRAIYEKMLSDIVALR